MALPVCSYLAWNRDKMTDTDQVGHDLLHHKCEKSHSLGVFRIVAQTFRSVLKNAKWWRMKGLK